MEGDGPKIALVDSKESKLQENTQDNDDNDDVITVPKAVKMESAENEFNLQDDDRDNNGVVTVQNAVENNSDENEFKLQDNAEDNDVITVHHAVEITSQNPDIDEPCESAMVRPYFGASWKIKDVSKLPEQFNVPRLVRELHNLDEKRPETNKDDTENESWIISKDKEIAGTEGEQKTQPTDRLLDSKSHISGDKSTYIGSRHSNGEKSPLSPEWPPKFTVFNLVSAIVSMIFFLVDIISDWRLAILYYLAGNKMTLFYLTVVFIVVPSVVASVISIVWSVMEVREEERSRHTENNSHRFCRVVMSFLQLGRCFRLLEYTWFVVKSWREKDPAKAKSMRKYALQQKHDSAILGLIDGFLESALQFLLQLYLSVSYQITMDFLRVATLCLSWMSTAMLHTSFYRNNRNVQRNRKNAGYTGSFFYFLWRMCELGPRFLLIVLFVFIFKFWSFIPVMFHFSFMLGFYIWQKPELRGICCRENKTFGYIFLILISYIGIFSYVNLTEGRTRKFVILYYIVFYVENITMAVIVRVFFPLDTSLESWRNCIYIVIPGFIFHVLFMCIYYKYFHPSLKKSTHSRKECCQPLKDLKICGVSVV